jgi:hypothetical protein
LLLRQIGYQLRSEKWGYVESDSFIVGPVEMIGRRGNGVHFVQFYGKSDKSGKAMDGEAEVVQVLFGNLFVSLGTPSTNAAISAADPYSGRVGGQESPVGLLIINADDWGRDRENTDRILECVVRGTVSSVSAMVFMEDSERAAGIALKQGIDTGLHLNFTTPFSGSGTPTRLIGHQQRLSRYLRWHRFGSIVFYPWLAGCFQYVVAAQLDEFRRIYGEQPNRIDGHHHMHLCANVVFGNLMPSGTVVRRNFSFWPGEKGVCNRMYRRLVDSMLQRRHHLSDLFFVLPPLEPPDRLQRIFSLARQFVVEVETHPVDPNEYEFLAGGEIFRRIGNLPIASRFAVPRCRGKGGHS